MENFLEKHNKLVIISISIFAVFIVFFRFTSVPSVWVDEGVFTEVSRNLSENNVLGIHTSQNEFFKVEGFLLSTSYPVIFPVAFSFKLFGIGIWQSRIVMVFYLLLTLLISYIFVKKVYGKYPAVLSLLFLLSFSPLYGNGRPVQGEVPGLFFLILGLYFLHLLSKSEFVNKRMALFSGLALGLSSATKPLFLTFIPVSLFAVLFIFLKDIKSKKILIYLLSGFLIPILIWFLISFSSNTSISEVINSYLYLSSDHSSGISSMQVILNNSKRFFTESSPMLFLIIFIISLTAFIFKWRKKDEESLNISEYFLMIFILLNIIGYLKGTGWYRYFFPANILLYLIMSQSLLYISSLLKRIHLKRIFTLFIFSLLAFQFYHLFFISDTSFLSKHVRNNELSKNIGDIDLSKNILFYNTIEASIFFKGENYSQYLKMEDFLVAGDENSILNTNYDYILTDKYSGGNVDLSCYMEKSFDKYLLFEKVSRCSN